jgi:hypothetical protein
LFRYGARLEFAVVPVVALGQFFVFVHLVASSSGLFPRLWTAQHQKPSWHLDTAPMKRFKTHEWIGGVRETQGVARANDVFLEI